MPEQPLTTEQILAQACDIDDVQAGHSTALAAAEKANAEHRAALDEAERLFGLYQQALAKAEQAGARASGAVARLRAWGEALERIHAAVRFLNTIESN